MIIGSRMKVLISRSSENQTIGGAELSAHDQAVVLKNLGHNPTFFSNNRTLRARLSKRNVRNCPSLYLQRFNPPFRYLYFFALIPVKIVYDLAVVLFVHPDIINPHTREDQISFTLLKPLHRRPVVWKDPGDMIFVLNQAHGWFGKVYKKTYLYSAKKADSIYLLNDDDRGALLQAIGKEHSHKLSSIPSSIMYESYSPAFDQKRSNELVFGTICRLTDTKNVSAVISAYLSIADSLPKSKLLVVGDGPERDVLESLAGGDPRIVFTGHTKDISPHLNSIDIFVHAALQEGWGRNIKEAMYFGKAIIGANVGGIALQISDGKNGLLFDPNNTRQLAQLMTELAKDTGLRNNLSRNARKKALSDGDFTDIVKDQIIPIYEKVLSAK